MFALIEESCLIDFNRHAGVAVRSIGRQSERSMGIPGHSAAAACACALPYSSPLGEKLVPSGSKHKQPCPPRVPEGSPGTSKM